MRKKSTNSPGRASLKGKKKPGGSIIISDPGTAKHKVHVDFDYQWTGQDPAGEFKLISKIGQGAYGKVYKAEHKDTGYVLAIKCIPVPESVSTDTIKELENLKKEIAILKNCRCPYIVSYYGLCFRHSTLWLMMELLEMGSVMDLMRETEVKNLSEQDVAYVMKCVVHGLVYLHSTNIIHRDLKGGNILLTSNGKAKLGDFGTSSYLKSGTQTVAGTPLFMSPEVLDEQGYNFKADIWSLGITALQIAEGKPPFFEFNVGKAMLRIVMGPPPTPREPQKWSKEFHDFISACLQHDAKARPDAKDLLKQPFVANVDPKYELSLLKKYRAIRAKKEDPTGLLTHHIEPQWPTGPGQQRVRREILSADLNHNSQINSSIIDARDNNNLNNSNNSNNVNNGRHSSSAAPPTYNAPPFLNFEDEGFDAKLTTLDRKELEGMVKSLQTQWKKERESKKKWKRIVKEGGAGSFFSKEKIEK